MLVSLVFHRNWFQPLACNVVALVPLFANTFAVSGVVGRACGQLADLHRSVVVLSTLAHNFSQALCVRHIWKNNKPALRVCPLSEKQRHGLFSREEEGETLGISYRNAMSPRFSIYACCTIIPLSRGTWVQAPYIEWNNVCL